jgi:glucosamine-6-phosphate deaminase
VLEAKGSASFIVATGASQFEMLDKLAEADLPWNKLTGFHLDEYVGLSINHEASFRKYLWERFVSRLPLPLAAFHFLDGEVDADAECRRASELIEQTSIDVAFVGIGENGHLAFNDPPADFDTEQPYLIVDLDEACRQQQFGEGWFPDLDSVPRQAISMSVRRIMKSDAIVCTVPDERKAEAVKNATQGPVTPEVPASILQEHPDCRLFLDAAAASLT